MDVGPNLGAINRSTLIGTDHLVFPLAADLFSIQGLRNLGPTIRDWRDQWTRMRGTAEDRLGDLSIFWPSGRLDPVGYIVLQHEVRLDRPVKAFDRWLNRIPTEYRRFILGEPPDRITVPDPADDPYRLGPLRNYRSLMPMAHEARKPMFDLKAADGAIGSHAALVRMCRQDFEALARSIAGRIGLNFPTDAANQPQI